MNEEQKDLINPESWTAAELIKHIYRELKKTHEELSVMKRDLSELKDDMKLRKQQEQNREKDFNKRVSIAAVIGVVFGLIIDALIGFLK